MTQRRAWARYSIRSIAKCAALIGCGLFPHVGFAEDIAVGVETTLGFGRGAKLQNDEGDTYISFETSPSFYTVATAERKSGARGKFIFDADLEITGDSTFYGTSGTKAGASAAYQRQFGENNAWQYRLRGNVDRSYSEGAWDFHRERLGFQLRYRHDPSRFTSGMVRIGYREQNENNLEGFDQVEYLGQLMHMWRPNEDRLAFAGTVYAESRRADLDRFSYDEAGVRVMVRVPLSEATEITARTTFYQREYNDAFSLADPTIRDDDRLKAVFEVDHSFNEKLSGAAYAGWDENTSNIAERAHADATFGLSLTYKFR